jgi:YbbR domain-containing protein
VEVKAIWKKDAPPGLKYTEPVIHPYVVTIRGREDRVNRVDKVVAVASPTEPKASIEGDFTLSARDNDNNPIEGITITPDTAHVTITQVPEPLTKVVIVSLIIFEQPAPPYKVLSDSTTPNQVLISGSPSRLNFISRIETENVSLRDLTADKTMTVNLIIPPDITVRDMQGHPITSVTAHFHIVKEAAQPGQENTAPPTPKREGTGAP